MEFEILGWPGEAVTLDLDHERFAYAGKFVMSRTGKAVARAGSDFVAAVAFDADRTDESVCRLRYVTVREDRRGEGIGPRLLAFVRSVVVREGGYEAVKIAVNNPFAYDAAYRAGFGYTGAETGIAELVLAWPRPAQEEEQEEEQEEKEDPPGTTPGTGDGSTAGPASAGGSTQQSPDYRAGLERFRHRSGDRALSEGERQFVEEALARGPPEQVEVPQG